MSNTALHPRKNWTYGIPGYHAFGDVWRDLNITIQQCEAIMGRYAISHHRIGNHRILSDAQLAELKRALDEEMRDPTSRMRASILTYQKSLGAKVK